ncbi:hypothetical protein ACOSQ2_008308 [Xanthoceras sorbifolium]
MDNSKTSVDRFTIKITLTEADVQSGRFYLALNTKEVEEHIFKHWREIVIKRATIDDIKVTMEDVDTSSEHEVNFRCYKHNNNKNSYSIQGLWRRNFIERRSLRTGDQIGIYCDPFSAKLCFSVLKRAR